MTLPVYPVFPGLGFPIGKSHEFNTIVQDSPNLMDTRISQTRNPRWHWELTYEVLRENAALSEYRTLRGFLLSLQGQGGDFLYDDPADDAVGPAVISGVPNAAAQLQVVTDGAGGFYSPLQRNLGGFMEDITDLNGSITVYDNGTLKTGGGTDYTLLGPGLAVSGSSFMGLYIAWTVAPTGPVTAQFDFYFRCRMEDDQAQFDQFISSLWTAGGSEAKSSGALKFMSSRIPQV